MTNASSTAIQKAGRVERAQQRLAKAINGLEAAFKGATATAADPQLAEEINQLRADNQRLAKTRADLGQRLDGVIGRLRAVVEE